MKKLLLLSAFLLGIDYCASAQADPSAAGTAGQAPSDSLTLMYRRIDQMDVFDLKKQREAYVYKCRKEPCEHNRAVLAYIEERMKKEQ